LAARKIHKIPPREPWWFCRAAQFQGGSSKMATPIISTLRRNQGYVMAVMGVVLIITWVIGTQGLDFFTGGPRGGQPAQPVMVQWTKAGSPQFLTEKDLVRLRQEHMAVLDFVNRVVKTAIEKKAIPQAPGLNLRPNQQGQIQLGLGPWPTSSRDTNELTALNILLFAERGREMGVRVDKDAMVSYLKNLSGFSLEEGDFRDLAKKTVDDAVAKSQVISVDSLFAALRKELTSQQAQYMTGASVTNVSTGELWDLHKQLNLRYRIEAYPIDVEKLKANFKTADAKPDELMALFTKGKNRVPEPDFPDPGFKTPHRIAFGYCTVDFDVFLAIAKKNVKEEQALERYQKGVAQGDYRKPKPLPGTEKPKEPAPGEGKPGEEKTSEPEKKEEPKPGEPKPEEKPAEKPAEKKAEPATEKPTTEKPAADKSVAVVCDDDPAKKAKPDDEKPAETKPAEKKAPAKEETKSEPAKTEPGKTEPAKTPDAVAPGEKTEEPAKTEKIEEKEEIQHKTFQEVRDEILTELAQPEATQLRNEAAQNAIEELRAYSAKLKRFEESKKDKQPGVEDPGAFRPDSFAKKYKFAYGKTNLVDQYQAATTVLGQNAILQSPQGSLMFAQFAFELSASLYDPQEASSFGETKYIYWRTDDQPEQDVELEKDGSFSPALKAQVEQAWLKQKAFEAAKKQAEELAGKAKGSSLRDVVGKGEDGKVVQPIPFSMYTSDGFLAFGGQPRYSQPNGIPMARKEFMDAVFALKAGEAGVAVDQPHNVVYAVHVLADEPSLEIRREMFLNALQRGMMSDLMGFAGMEKQMEMQSLFDDLEKHFNVKWMQAVNSGRGGEE
jgi:hypothetical protein